MPNIFMYYILPQSLSFNLQHSSCKLVFSISVENSVDPDQMASGSTVFSKRIILGSAGQGSRENDNV